MIVRLLHLVVIIKIFNILIVKKSKKKSAFSFIKNQMDINFFKKTRILDGGMGQELLARGMKPQGTLWSATAILNKNIISCFMIHMLITSKLVQR